MKTITVKTRNGDVEVKAHVFLRFGCHKQVVKEKWCKQHGWVVTHVATGFRAINARTLKQGKVAMAELEAMPFNWNFTKTSKMEPLTKAERSRIDEIRVKANVAAKHVAKVTPELVNIAKDKIEKAIEIVKPEAETMVKMLASELQITKDNYDRLLELLLQMKDKFMQTVFLTACVRAGFPRWTAAQVALQLGVKVL